MSAAALCYAVPGSDIPTRKSKKNVNTQRQGGKPGSHLPPLSPLVPQLTSPRKAASGSVGTSQGGGRGGTIISEFVYGSIGPIILLPTLPCSPLREDICEKSHTPPPSVWKPLCGRDAKYQDQPEYEYFRLMLEAPKTDAAARRTRLAKREADGGGGGGWFGELGVERGTRGEKYCTVQNSYG